MPDKENPTRQIPIAPRFFLTAAGAKQSDPALARSPRRRAAADAGRLVHHRPGQPLVRQGVRQPDLVCPDGRGLLRADRRHRPGAHAPGSGGARAAGRSVASRRLRHPLAVPHDHEHRRPISVGCGRPPARPARRRSPRAAPAGSAPTRSSRPSPWPSACRWTPTATWSLPPPGTGRSPGQVRTQSAWRSQTVAASRQEGRARPPGCRLPPPKGKAGAALRRGGPRAVFERLFGVDPSVPNDDVLGTIPQALFMMNSGLVNGRIAAGRVPCWARSSPPHPTSDPP